MDKRIFICAGVILILAILGIFAYNYFDIYPGKRYIPPSQEVSTNYYYALEQWLKETGHSVRIEPWSNPKIIAETEEKTVVIHADNFFWNDAEEYLIPWIKQGKSLVICINYYHESDIDSNLLEFLSGIGIAVETTPSYYTYTDEDIPDFHWRYKFTTDNDKDFFTVNDVYDNIRLAEAEIGEGTITVIGVPAFMQNYPMENEKNARLAWQLTGARLSEDNTGVLFIREIYRERQGKSIFGALMQRGNLVPVIAGALILIVLGFWMVIPVFGLVFREKQRVSRPIKERFAAETGFLKKYNGLDYYLKTYERELQIERNMQLTHNSESKENYNEWEIINKLRSVCYGTDELKRRICGFTAGTGKE